MDTGAEQRELSSRNTGHRAGDLLQHRVVREEESSLQRVGDAKRHRLWLKRKRPYQREPQNPQWIWRREDWVPQQKELEPKAFPSHDGLQGHGQREVPLPAHPPCAPVPKTLRGTSTDENH